MFLDSLNTRTRTQTSFPPQAPDWRRGLILFGLLTGLIFPLLSGCHSPEVDPVTTQTPTTSAKPKAKEESKINANLLELERQVQQEQLSLQQAGANMAMAVSAEGVKLEIVTSRIDDQVEKQLSMPGVKLHHVSRKYNRVSASVNDLALLHQLAKVPEVVMIKPQYAPRTH